MYLGSWSISMAWKPRLWRDQAIHRSWEWNHTIIHKELWRMAKNQQQNHCSVRLPKIWFTTSPWKSLLHFQKHRTPKSIVNSFTHKLFHPSKTWLFLWFFKNFSVLYKQSSLEDEPKVFLDPNTFSTDGTIALNSMVFSEDGRLVAYSLSESGSDWTKIKIRNVETGEDYPELLKRTKFPAISWTHDHKGFFYGVSVQRRCSIKLLLILMFSIYFVSVIQITLGRPMVLKQMQMKIWRCITIESVRIRNKTFWLSKCRKIHHGLCKWSVPPKKGWDNRQR